jgi:hypothetical protein
MSPTPEQFEQANEELMARTIQRVRGLEKDHCAFDRPQDSYFVSSIAPQASGEEGEFTESKPNLIGLKLKPTNQVRYLDIDVHLEVYLPSFPTREEYESLDTSSDQNAGRHFQVGTAFYRRLAINYETEVDTNSYAFGSEDWHEAEAERITEELNERIAEEVSAFAEDHLVCLQRGGDTSIDLDDPDHFEEHRTALRNAAGDLPDWRVGFDIVERNDEISLRLHNESDEDQAEEVDAFIFNPKIGVEGEFSNYVLSLIPQEFRYDRKIWGKGENCSVSDDELEVHEDESTGSGRLETTAVPEHQSKRFKQREEHMEYTHLEKLSNPDRSLEALENLEGEMQQYHAKWTGPLKREKANELDEEELEEFEDAAENFQHEIDRFGDGIQILNTNEDARQAFLLMNQAFANQDGPMESWYPFQAVFIVSNLKSIVAREYPNVESDTDQAEVLWFPTGGGKTEAYLGLIVFALLFDRIRGKDEGVSAWIRFPLRLLGKQQKDRFLTTLHEADKVRQEELDGAGSEFSIGYFVGSHDTPNSIADGGRNNYHSTFQKDQEALRNECLVVDSCPECGGDVDVEFDPEANKVYHVCEAEDCSLGRLPLYVVDHDIYREVPSVLLGTLDKISIAGSNPRFANLLGNFTTKCPDHGLGYAGKCSEASTVDCSKAEDVDKELYDPIPTLHLVDEVHLLNEELGVFAGQYETLYQQLCRELSDGNEPKIITSTATIAEYEEHMENLFLKDANRFPEEGPTLDESFYGYVDEDEDERRYLGITPVNKTHIYAVLDLAKKYHQTIRDARSNGFESIDVDSSTRETILDYYELSVVYFLRKTEKDRFLRSIENQINKEMENDGYDIPLSTAQLTADIESTDVLDKLQDPEGSFEERTDIVGATSFIGHGIDVDRFNTMFFFGFPSETFQYIQSSARVGREKPGSVVDVFRPYDERDKHRYKYFSKSHEYLRRSVEAVSIDRWSKFSLEKTFPGIFSALLMQHFRPIMHRKYGINVQSSKELEDVISAPNQYPEFNREEYERLIEQSFGLHKRDNDYFEKRISEKTEAYWSYWLKQLRQRAYTTIKEESMISLRDIGDQVEISPDTDEIQFYNNLIGGN